ncbi:MAG TPA: hypothetical protein VF453_06340 [Burkholderiaceae bacterium]
MDKSDRWRKIREAIYGLIALGAVGIVAAGAFVAMDDRIPRERSTPVDVAEVRAPAAPPPRHHAYVYESDGIYGYRPALSEQDRQNGISTKPLLTVRYLGLKGDRHTWVAFEGGPENQIEFECTSPCHFVNATPFNFMGRTGQTEVMEAVEGSMLGAVVGDILAGDLKISGFGNDRSSAQPAASPTSSAL